MDVFDDICQMPEFYVSANFLDYTAFTRRLRDLRKALEDRQDWAFLDSVALAHNRALFPMPMHDLQGEPRWEGSKAEQQL